MLTIANNIGPIAVIRRRSSTILKDACRDQDESVSRIMLDFTLQDNALLYTKIYKYINSRNQVRQLINVKLCYYFGPVAPIESHAC